MIFLELFVSFVLIGFTSFGGLSMIPLIKSQMLSHGWMTAQELSDIVAIAEMTPGPVGLNCATFAGTRVAGLAGALCASAGVLLPSFTICMLAAVFLKKFKESHVLQNALYGIRPVCIGMIGAVVIDLSISNYAGNMLGVSPVSILIGAASFCSLFFLKWSVPKTILLSAALGLLLGWLPC